MVAKLRRAMQRVVVADDNPAMTAALKVVLQIWGWDVLVAHDGMTAVEAIRASRPALALIDIGLPDLDGLEVARVLRAAGRGAAFDDRSVRLRRRARSPRLAPGRVRQASGEARRSGGAAQDDHARRQPEPRPARRYGAAPSASVSRSPIRREPCATPGSCAQTWFHPARDDESAADSGCEDVRGRQALGADTSRPHARATVVVVRAAGGRDRARDPHAARGGADVPAPRRAGSRPSRQRIAA